MSEEQFLNNIKLSALLAGEYGNPEYAFGVSVDEESFTPPEGIKEIGFIYKVDEDGDLDEDLLDVIISYGLSSVRVMLEIPYEEVVEDASYIMSVASNAGFSISVLPPVEVTEESAAGYTERLVNFTKAFLNQKNFAKEIFPITSYLEYMYLEQLIDVSGYEAKDPYMITKFVEKTTVEFSDSFKATMRVIVFDHFGGEDGFKEFSKAVFHKIYQLTESNCQDVVANMAEQAKGDGEAEQPEG